MRAALVVVQILITLVIVAVTIPVVLVFVPAAQNPMVGPGLALGLAIIVFAVLRLGWPRRAR
jgi:hypothetical protein